MSPLANDKSFRLLERECRCFELACMTLTVPLPFQHPKQATTKDLVAG